jgi:hypothetical protein
MCVRTEWRARTKRGSYHEPVERGFEVFRGVLVTIVLHVPLGHITRYREVALLPAHPHVVIGHVSSAPDLNFEPCGAVPALRARDVGAGAGDVLGVVP